MFRSERDFKTGCDFWACEISIHVHGVTSHKTVTRISIAAGATTLVPTVPDLGSGYVPDGGAQVDFCASRRLSMDMAEGTQGGPAEVQTPAHSNLIGPNMTAPPPALSPSSILPPPSIHSASIAKQKHYGACLKNVVI